MAQLWLWNIAAYSAQTAMLLAAGGLALRALEVRTPRWRLLCWQFLLAACLLLPLLESWHPAPGGVSILISEGTSRGGTRRPSGGLPDLPWAELLGGVLAAGAAVRLGLFCLGLARLNGYRRRSRTEPEVAGGAPERLGVRAEIRASDEIPGPVTFGLFHPVILVPTRWAKSEAVLFHELIHVRRRDWVFLAGEELIRAMLWFHPLVWWAIVQIQLAREEVVDREVIELTQSREQYLETLLAIAAARSGLDLAPAPLFLRKRHLRSRVASLMKEVSMSRLRLQFSLTGFLTLTLLAGWLAVRAFPLRAAQESSTNSARTHPITLEVKTDQGVVEVSVEIDREGKLLSAAAVSGPAEARQGVLDAVHKWRYTRTPAGAVEVDTGSEGGGYTVAVANQPPTRIKVGGEMQAANLIKKVTPAYPAAAKAAGIQGVVRLTVRISAQGKVEDVQIAEGDPQLADAAVTAVRQWQYRPTLLNGEPVAVLTEVNVNFTLLK